MGRDDASAKGADQPPPGDVPWDKEKEAETPDKQARTPWATKEEVRDPSKAKDANGKGKLTNEFNAHVHKR